jgi:ADP-ribose pyrophosphatase YjhB (NUDIX family)
MNPSSSEWLAWVQELQAIAQCGLTFSADPYDRERYLQLQQLAATIAALHTSAPFAAIDALFAGQSGYATPRIEVRGAVFNAEGLLLLVREVADQHRWTLPGGWLDVGLSPAEGIRREILQESGYQARITKLVAVWDRRHHPYPRGPFACVVLFFLAELIGGEEEVGLETSGSGWFGRDELPLELSLGRVLPEQLIRMFAHYDDPSRPTDFD